LQVIAVAMQTPLLSKIKKLQAIAME